MNCNICKNPFQEIFIRGDEFLWCSSCCLCKTLKQSVQVSLSSNEYKRYFLRKRQRLVKYILHHVKKNSRFNAFQRALDIGCSGGGSFGELNCYYNEVVGLDLSLDVLKKIKNENVSLIQGDCKVLPFKSNSFDLILLMDVIEHVENFLEVLESCNKALRPEGFLVLKVPNISPYLSEPLNYFARKAFDIYANYYPLQKSNHIWHFNEESILGILEKRTKFKIIKQIKNKASFLTVTGDWYNRYLILGTRWLMHFLNIKQNTILLLQKV